MPASQISKEASHTFLTFGTRLENKSKMLCLPDLATRSFWHNEEVVTAKANELARAFAE
jgi:hypothetical protein